jgi:hypothetical protein
MTENQKNTNEVQIIRKGVYKDYLNPALLGGWILGLISFLVSLKEKPVISALWIGLFVWIVIIITFMVIGFFGYEYFERKRRIKKLKSEKYSFLHAESFQLQSDLFFEGTYKEYFFRILPMSTRHKRKEIEYDIIEAYYTFDLEDDNEEKEKNLTGEWFLGELHFSNYCVGFLPKDWQNPDFKANLDGLISIFKRENLKPFSKDEWENSFGKKLKEQQEKEEKARTKQVVKIGKLLDIKYIKKNNS